MFFGFIYMQGRDYVSSDKGQTGVAVDRENSSTADTLRVNPHLTLCAL